MSSVSLIPKGANFMRVAAALGISSDPMIAAEYAGARWGEHSAPAQILKAAVSAGSTIPDGSWGSALAVYNNAYAEFIEMVRQLSIVGRLAGLRRIPPRTRGFGVSTGANASWSKQGRATAVASMSFAAYQLDALVIAAVVVVTDELLRSSDPAAEAVIRNDLVRACAEQMDATFIDAANAGEADVSPASIAYGAPSVVSTGDPRVDLRVLMEEFGGDLSAAFLVTDPDTATQMALWSSASGDSLFPDLGPRGGTALGIPVLTSRSSPRADSPAAGQIVLVDPTGIAFGEGRALVSASRHGTVEMQTEPVGDGIAPVATQLVSLYQINGVGIQASLEVNWQRVRAGSVAVLTGVNYSA